MSTRGLRTIVRQEVQPLKEELSHLRELLTGNGEPAKGVVVRLDRLEQQDAKRADETRWLRRTLVGTLLAAAASAAAAWLH